MYLDEADEATLNASIAAEVKDYESAADPASNLATVFCRPTWEVQRYVIRKISPGISLPRINRARWYVKRSSGAAITTLWGGVYCGNDFLNATIATPANFGKIRTVWDDNRQAFTDAGGGWGYIDVTDTVIANWVSGRLWLLVGTEADVNDEDASAGDDAITIHTWYEGTSDGPYLELIFRAQPTYPNVAVSPGLHNGIGG